MFGRPMAIIALVAVLATAGCGGGSPPLAFDSATSTSPTTHSGVASSVAATTTTTTSLAPNTTAVSTTTSTTTSVAPSTTIGPTTTTVPAPPQRLAWNGGTAYIHGANLPWINYDCDFGCGTLGGVSTPDTAAEVETAFAAAEDAGMNVVRWWLFPGDLKQFTTDAAGMPTGITDATYADIDAALAIAQRHGLALILTVFSSPTQLPTSWLSTDAGRQQVADVLGQMFARYRNDRTIMTWDVVNEPEYAIWSGAVVGTDVQQLISTIAAKVHEVSDTLVSVGGARMDGLSMMTNLGLDYYTVHWYDPMTAADQCLSCVSAADVSAMFGLDKPIVVGEFYAGPDEPGRFQLFHDLGYAGGLPWSLEPEHTADQFQIDLAAAATFASANRPL